MVTFKEELMLKIHMMSEGDSESGDPGIAVADEVKIEQPKMYKVLMHNDDYTTMEFVIHTLMKFFSKNYDEAHSIMLKVHNEGMGICGIFTFEVAESKSAKVNRYSRGKGHPLKCTIEPCES